jgi:hypothetical protein
VRWAVILAGGVALWAQILLAQTAARAKNDQGPRALGLLELAPNGKAHLIPVAIMYDGEFYDASIYKASPVPMALEPGTVYEAERTGASLGLFTISGDLQSRNNTWMAEGSFEPAGAKPKSSGHLAKSVPRGMEDDSGPPRLLRREEKPNPPASTPAPASAPAPPSSPDAAKPGTASGSTAPAASAPSSQAPATSAPAQPSPNAKAAPPAAPATPAPAPAEQQDVYRPILRRGKAQWTSPNQPDASLKTPAVTGKAEIGTAGIMAKGATGVQIVPAVSDAGGPEPHPYTYPAKPDELQQIRKKVLAMASAEVLAWMRQSTSEKVSAPAPKPTSRRARAAKPPQPVFDNVELRVLDLSLSNEPVAVLTATAHMPPSAKGPAGRQYYVTLVAHEDIYGDLHKAFSQVTDDQHLDLAARYEFIDAVDADGDGRGDLLFRTISSGGKAYTIYRLIGDQVWPLFQGTPGP